MLTGTGLVVIYAGVSVAAIAGRINGTTDVGHYRMPLFPLGPVAQRSWPRRRRAADLLDPDVGPPQPDRQPGGDGWSRPPTISSI